LSDPRRAAAAVFAVAFAVYLLSPVRQISDSYFALLAAHQLAVERTLDLAPRLAADGSEEVLGSEGARFPRRDGLPYQLRRQGERVLYDFPLGGSLLAAPWVGAAHALGAGVLDGEGRYDAGRDAAHQRLLAALCAALFAAAAFAALDRLLPRSAALWTTAALALATPLWSTASRGYWSQSAALALLGLALPLLDARARGAGAGGARLGLLLAGAYLCRPTAAIALALVGGDLLRRDRRAAWRFAIAVAGVLAAFVLFSWWGWGALLPPYYASTRLARPAAEALAGILFSPSRGLFVFAPALAAALLFGAARWGTLALRPLFGLGALGLGAHALVVASFAHWSGGHGFGPRLFAETVFYQALVAASVVATLVRDGALGRGWRRTLVALAVAGALLHAPGALSRQSNRWNWSPAPIDEHPERIWSWRDPQFLAWANRGPRRASTAKDSSEVQDP
jgi:hypothetical protein